ncbi:MAG: hypothetical protein KC457_30085, partial [Myxococcales bacterium]|nr:hypothetical protein [Myxococcales bacterium]
ARLVAVGTGGRQYARDFIEERGIPYLVLIDKTLESHGKIGIAEGPKLGVLRPRVLWAALKAFLAGNRQGKTGPNPFKYGAAHVIGPGGRLHYAWLNDDYHDNAPLDELLEAAARASGRQLAA